MVLPIAPPPSSSSSSSSSVKAAVLLPSSPSSSALCMGKGEAKATSPRLESKADLTALDDGRGESKAGDDAKQQQQEQEDEKKERQEQDEGKEGDKDTETEKGEEKPDDAHPPEKSDVALTCPLDSQASEKKSGDRCEEKPLGGHGEGEGEGVHEKEEGAPGPAAAAAGAPGPAAAAPVLLSGRGGPSTMEDDWLTQLPCSHLFHPNCIIPWMEMKQVRTQPILSLVTT